MTESAPDGINETELKQEQRRELRSYLWGYGLALLLTLASFAFVYWDAAPRLTLLIIIGILALWQMVVHFRYFLHIGLGQNREDLYLILFSVLLLIIMVGGTVWIMVDLSARMSTPILPPPHE